MSSAALALALAAAVLHAGWNLRLAGEADSRAGLAVAALAGAVCCMYALVLLALDRAEAAPVAAVRETSVVIATALAAVLLRERVTKARLAGSVVVVAGVVLIAMA